MVQKEAIAACPACQFTPGLADRPSNQQGPGSNGTHKRGRWATLARNSMPVCAFCKGRKFVYLDKICECGMPAVWYFEKMKVWCCGSDICARAAERRITGVGTTVHWYGL